MAKKSIIIVATILLITTGIFIYLMTTNNESNQSEINASWNESIEILNSGQVEEVFQEHNLEVTLILKNDTIIHTKEPKIDDIFDEVKKCGNQCDNIILSTE